MKPKKDSELSKRWLEIYKATFHQLRGQGYTEDQATVYAGQIAYQECDKLAKAKG